MRWLAALGAALAIPLLALVGLSLPAQFDPLDVWNMVVAAPSLVAEMEPWSAAWLGLGVACWSTLAAVSVGGRVTSSSRRQKEEGQASR